VRITRKTSLVALVAAGVVSVSGCGITEAGAAITYTGGQIAEQLVADQAQELADQLEIAVVPEVTQVTVQRLATNVLVDAGAEQLGVSITGAEVDAVLAVILTNTKHVVGGHLNNGPFLVQHERRRLVDGNSAHHDGRSGHNGFSNASHVSARGKIHNGVGARRRRRALSLEPTSDLLSRPADNALSIDELVVGSR